MERLVYSVSQVNLYIKNMFIREPVLQYLSIKGEISNCKYHSSGHIYFTLKDAKSQISCVMFAGQRSGLSFRLSEGQSVVVMGSLSVYERDGKYQLYAKKIELDGFGALYEEFLRRKEQLLREGLFDEEKKRKLPYYAKRIGIATSETGAVIRDIVTVAKRRNPYVSLYLYPVKVQGEGAATSIARGLAYLDRQEMDVLIVGRGGGSLEDLWAFNEEEVARAIAACKTPVISAVGHETDTTIADFAADLRAPTPSAAAELAVCDMGELESDLLARKYDLNRKMKAHLKEANRRLEGYTMRLKYAEPERLLMEKQQILADMQDALERTMAKRLEQKKQRLSVSMERLKGLSPLSRLEKGFGYLSDSRGCAVRSAEQVEEGQELTVQLKDGKLETKVLAKDTALPFFADGSF